MRFSRSLLFAFASLSLICSVPSFAQESLGDAARRIRAQKAAAAPQPTVAPKPQSASQPLANAGVLWQEAFNNAEEAMMEGEYVAAEGFYRRAAAIAESSSPAPSNIAYAYDGLGSALRLQRKYADAESAFRTALKYWAKAPARYEEMTARTKAGLGTALVGLERYPEAEQLLLESAKTLHQHPEAEICAQSMPLNGLAQLYRATKDISKGERVYTEAFALLTTAQGTPCAVFVSLLDHLAGLYADANQWEKVEKVQQGAISLALQMQGPQSKLYGDTLFAYARTLSDRRRFEEAASTAAQAAKAFRDSGSLEEVANSLQLQEINLTRAGKTDEARQLHKAVESAVADANESDEAGAMMAIRTKSQEAFMSGNIDEAAHLAAQELAESRKLSTHYQVDALTDSAMINIRQQKSAEAERDLKEALDLSIASTGPTSDSTGSAHFQLANFFRNAKRWPEAEEHFSASLSAAGPHDPDKVRIILPSLAATYMAQNKYDKAEPIYQRMLKNAEESNSVTGIAGALEYLAILYSKTNRMSEAEVAVTRAMQLTESLTGGMKFEWASAAMVAGDVYAQGGKQLQAEQLYMKTVEFMEKNLGPTHPAVRMPLEKLIALLKSNGKSAEAAKYQTRIDGLPPMPQMPGM